jgi:hypothetical protein
MSDGGRSLWQMANGEWRKKRKALPRRGPSPHPFPFSRMEKGKLEPPLSAWERGGGEDGRGGNLLENLQPKNAKTTPRVAYTGGSWSSLRHPPFAIRHSRCGDFAADSGRPSLKTAPKKAFFRTESGACLGPTRTQRDPNSGGTASVPSHVSIWSDAEIRAYTFLTRDSIGNSDSGESRALDAVWQVTPANIGGGES